MAWDINHVVLIGRLTSNPELRYGQSGAAYCRFAIAVNRKSMKEGQEDEVYFIDILTFGKTAELAGKYLARGKQVCIQGYLRQNRWTAQDGRKNSKIEVVSERVQFLTPLSGESSSYKEPAPSPSYAANSAVENKPEQMLGDEIELSDEDDEDIPF